MSWTWNPEGISPFLYSASTWHVLYALLQSSWAFPQCSLCSYKIILSMIQYMGCAIYTILLSLCLTLPLPSVVLFSEPKMPPHHTSLSVNSLVCCHSLATKLDCEDSTMCPCKKCVSCGLTCHVDKDSSKCNKCTHTSFQKCNLVLSETEWAKVQHKQLHLCQKVHEMTAQLIHLQKQSDLMKSCWEEMVWWELQNIEELKVNEAREAFKTAIMPSLNDFLLNMSSDQIEVLMEFNPAYWSENIFFKGTSQ